jgi:chemotaxis protein MotA
VDIFALTGILAGLGLTAGAVFLGPSPGRIPDPAALMFVFGGSWAALLLTFTPRELRRAAREAVRAFTAKPLSTEDVVSVMVRLAEISRREGIAALEKVRSANPVLEKAARLIAGNADTALIRDILAVEAGVLRSRRAVDVSVFTRLALFMAAAGVLGTLIGFMRVCAVPSAPDMIGRYLAPALACSLYGCLPAVFVLLPAAGRLWARGILEERRLHVIFAGAECILENNNPRFVHGRLLSFLSPEERAHAS